MLGGRKMGVWVTAISAQASDMSGWLLLGLPGFAYTHGFEASWIALGLFIGLRAWSIKLEKETAASSEGWKSKSGARTASQEGEQ